MPKDIVEIPLLLVTDERRAVKRSSTGRDVKIKIPELVQNDAGALYEILDGIDTAKEPYRAHRRTVTRLRRDMRKHREAAEDVLDGLSEEAGNVASVEVGVWEVTLDALEMIVTEVIKSPPASMQFKGFINETLMYLEDELDAFKKKNPEYTGTQKHGKKPGKYSGEGLPQGAFEAEVNAVKEAAEDLALE